MAKLISSGRLRALSSVSSAGTFGPVEVHDGESIIQAIRSDRIAIDPSSVWESQPSVRKVVDFMARAVASTPLKVYRRNSETDRVRVRDHALTRVLGRPSAGVTPFRFWHSVLVDWMLFDRWAVLKVVSDDVTRGLDLVRLQANRFAFKSDGFGRVASLEMANEELDPASFLFDHGYSPGGANGTTPIRTLADILTENREAVAYRRAIWRNGARVPMVIERPQGAPEWTDSSLGRFKAGWKSFMKGGSQAGGTPVLEDGMKAVKVDSFSPKDTLDIEGRRLSDIEVASAFHIAPELVGAREGTYSNIQAYRQGLYRDGLGPVYEALEQVLNVMLVPDLDETGDLYVEFDVQAKLRGSFEEQAQILQTSTGGPWLTRNEARARLNLPAIEGGDELIVPLNVITGGQASPTDSAPKARLGVKARRKSVSAKASAEADPELEQRVQDTLGAFFARQRRAVLSRLGPKAEWWDEARWDAELADDLMSLAVAVTAQIGAQAAAELGNPGGYDVERTRKFLRAVAESRASAINATTRSQILEVLAEAAAWDGEGDEPTPASVFDNAETSRKVVAAVTLVTTFASFAVTEAGKQSGATFKTWRVTSKKPRPEHRAMDGETVGVWDVFSNGADWPGDPILGADGVAGCVCDVVVGT